LAADRIAIVTSAADQGRRQGFAFRVIEFLLVPAADYMPRSVLVIDEPHQ
jgi:hypothetical protein